MQNYFNVNLQVLIYEIIIELKLPIKDFSPFKIFETIFNNKRNRELMDLINKGEKILVPFLRL